MSQQEIQQNVRLLSPVQNAVNNPRLEFRNGQYLFCMTNLEGALVERFISDAAVREAFAKVPVDSSWMPPNVARWGDGQKGEWAICYFEPGEHMLEITNDGQGVPYALARLSVPLPGLVFFGNGTQYNVWAVKTAKLDPFQEIYRCPLPNVYQDGSICWGHIKPPRMTARTILEAWKLFIMSTFNNHLANGKSKRSRDDVRRTLNDMARSPRPASYPVKDLIRQVDVTGVTLDQAIREYFETGKMPG